MPLCNVLCGPEPWITYVHRRFGKLLQSCSKVLENRKPWSEQINQDFQVMCLFDRNKMHLHQLLSNISRRTVARESIRHHNYDAFAYVPRVAPFRDRLRPLLPTPLRVESKRTLPYSTISFRKKSLHAIRFRNTAGERTSKSIGNLRGTAIRISEAFKYGAPRCRITTRISTSESSVGF